MSTQDQLKKQLVNNMVNHCASNGIDQNFGHVTVKDGVVIKKDEVNVMHTFNFIQNNDEDVELEYFDDDLELQGDLYLDKLLNGLGFDETLEILFKDRFEEVRKMFTDALKNNDKVIRNAENAAIETFKGI